MLTTLKITTFRQETQGGTLETWNKLERITFLHITQSYLNLFQKGKLLVAKKSFLRRRNALQGPALLVSSHVHQKWGGPAKKCALSFFTTHELLCFRPPSSLAQPTVQLYDESYVLSSTIKKLTAITSRVNPCIRQRLSVLGLQTDAVMMKSSRDRPLTLTSFVYMLLSQKEA